MVDFVPFWMTGYFTIFCLYHLPKTDEPRSYQSATICSLFELLHSNYEN